jgi:hypothetical protein
MTLLNMKNVNYVSSPHKLIVDSNVEHAIVDRRRALVTSVSMRLNVYH